MDPAAGFGAFEGKRYLNLETYRKSGAGVRTPVWFAAAPAEAGVTRFYVYATADSGKAKRLRRSSLAKIAPCDARGKVTGAWVVARAEIVSGAEFDRGMALLNRKYWPVKQALDVLTRLFSRHQRIMIAIGPA
ncbi:MAG TPA: PPOX class F420-dependent oxidoreductase [Rhodopila sp.]